MALQTPNKNASSGQQKNQGSQGSQQGGMKQKPDMWTDKSRSGGQQQGGQQQGGQQQGSQQNSGKNDQNRPSRVDKDDEDDTDTKE